MSAKRLFLVALVATVLPAALPADVLVSASSTNVNFAAGLGGPDNYVAETSWTFTDSFSGVAVAARLFSINALAAAGTAYLTMQVGPGTSPASLIASSPFTAPLGTQPSNSTPLTQLFTGLALGPGTYHLVLAGTPVGQSPLLFWQGSNGFTLGTGVGYLPGHGSAVGAASNSAFPPASTFTFFTSPPDSTAAVSFAVTGQLVLEPSALAAAIAAITAVAAARRWRRR